MRHFYVVLALFCASCGRHYLVLNKVEVDRDSLASTYARSPDPMQDNLPVGEEIYITWFFPIAFRLEGYSIILEVVYKDLTEERVVFPIRSPAGVQKFQLVGYKFEEKKGFLTYKAALLDGEGGTVDVWQHVMWVKVVS